jgi:hypothetical protein
MIVVHSLGKNTTVVESSDGPVYTYQYKRTINNGPLWITFSFSLEELEDLKKKEIGENKPKISVSDQWNEIERLNELDLLLRSKR